MYKILTPQLLCKIVNQNRMSGSCKKKIWVGNDHLNMDRSSTWKVTIITQICLCVALFVALNIGHHHIYRSNTIHRNPDDFYFISVGGGFRPFSEQTHLLKLVSFSPLTSIYIDRERERERGARVCFLWWLNYLLMCLYTIWKSWSMQFIYQYECYNIVASVIIYHVLFLLLQDFFLVSVAIQYSTLLLVNQTVLMLVCYWALAYFLR